MSPPHVKMESYFSGADGASRGRPPMNEWIHIVHTYQQGDSRISVTEPKTDPGLARLPAKDENPEEGQFYARDDKGVGTLFYNGTLTDAAAAVFLKLYANDQLIKTQMAAAWKTDFPNLKNYYVFQIWPNSCSMGGRDGSALICDFSPTRQQRNESPQNQFVLQLAPIALKA